MIGEDDMAYSLYSLHREGATFTYQSNMEGEMIKLLGDGPVIATKDISMFPWTKGMIP